MEIDLIFKIAAVGIIVSIYLLATKERCAAHARRAIYALTAGYVDAGEL